MMRHAAQDARQARKAVQRATRSGARAERDRAGVIA